ncbi:hypothetical protein HID58_028445 [Brassica napus]|uniref:RING-type E3 ubiquitin transferase n=1 Tax=Brassica napus TaxID=3708 RepID=A0ABQ8CA88_BRANA|nr:hypothetical protein HID58_028445 [Brassica napus]
MDDIDIAILELTIFMFMIICCCCCCRTGPVELPPQLIDKTPQTQQDIETGQIKGILFKDIKEKEEEEGCGKRCCPICLEEYEDDHEIRRLEKCRHIVCGREVVIRTETVGTKNPERRPLASIMLALRNSPDSMNMCLKEFIDPNMMDLYPHDCLFKIAMLAKQCVDDDPIDEKLIYQTPQPQQDIETGQEKGLMFKDIKEERCDKRSCQICLEEYEDDHEITRLKKCRLTEKRSCPICRCYVV